MDYKFLTTIFDTFMLTTLFDVSLLNSESSSTLSNVSTEAREVFLLTKEASLRIRMFIGLDCFLVFIYFCPKCCRQKKKTL